MEILGKNPELFFIAKNFETNWNSFLTFLIRIVVSIFVCILTAYNQFTRIFDQFQNLADIIATGQRISQMINFCIKSNKNVTDDQFYSCDTVVTDSNTTNRNELIQTSNTNEIVVSVNNLYLEQSNDMIDRKVSTYNKTS